MKTFLLTMVSIGLVSSTVLAISLPIAEDTFSSPGGLLTPANGKAAKLLLNANQAALVKFDLSSLPPAFNFSNIVSARIKTYILTARASGDLVAKAITGSWSESATGNIPVPIADATQIGSVPAARVVGKHFVTIDVTSAVVAALNGTGPNFGFLLQDVAGQTYIPAKEGPSQGPAMELEIEADLSRNVAGGSSLPGTLSVGGDLLLNGFFRQGSETGTAEPGGRGLIMRRIQSTNSTAGSIVARTDTAMLVRDGTIYGWKILRTTNVACNILAMGFDVNGVPLTKALFLNSDDPAREHVLFSDASQFPTYFHCIFGETLTMGHHTEVTLMLRPEESSPNWVGTLISTFNQ